MIAPRCGDSYRALPMIRPTGQQRSKIGHSTNCVRQVLRALTSALIAFRGRPGRRVAGVFGASVSIVMLVLLIPNTAHAGTSGGDSAGGTVTVGATDGGSSPGAPAGSGGGGEGSGGQGGSPWVCTYLKLVLNDGGGIAPGGPTPGSWYSVRCTDQSSGASTTQTEWIPDQSTATAPAVDPRSLALQAERSLQLPPPSGHFNPSNASTVNLPTWLWIDSGIWHPVSVTASAGTVSATAVANPVSVEWSMGDGAVVACRGPGTAFDSARPSSSQTTNCDYTYASSSAGQPSTDGNPNDGAFDVRATVTWTVSWSAQGAAGGGVLPTLYTSSDSLVRVEQVESINTIAYVPPTGGVLTHWSVS